jgi:hypothetical protein
LWYTNSGISFGGDTTTPIKQQKNMMVLLGHGGNLNTARTHLGRAGTQTLALAFGGGSPTATGATEEYDGTSWTTNPGSMATARNDLASGGTQAAALAFGGTSTCIQQQQKNLQEQVLH